VSIGWSSEYDKQTNILEWSAIMLIVQKYGGTSVADTEKIFCAAQRIAKDYLKNHDIVIVVSAQGHTTDILLEKADEISKSPSKRELDALLSTGEQQSAALMAMALVELGLPAISLNSQQAGIFSTSEHGQAKIVSINPDRINSELKKRNIVIITGFQGVDERGEIMTLGRGASDTTAIALAASLSADLCEIYTDVAGVYTADPRKIKDALKHREICYDAIMELSTMGASVLHNRSIELAKKFGVEFSVRSSFTNDTPSLIKQLPTIEDKVVSGITAERDICKVGITKIHGNNVGKLLHLLAGNGIPIDILTLESDSDFASLSFALPKSYKDTLTELLTVHKDDIFEGEFVFSHNLAKLSVVGAGIAYDSRVTLTFYEALMSKSVKIQLLSLSTLKISALISMETLDSVIHALHEKFKNAGMFEEAVL